MTSSTAVIRDLLTDRAALDALGLVAGALVAISGLPKVIARLRERREGCAAFSPADLLRDGAQAAGNLLWVVVGASLGLVSITFFCGLQAVLMGLLVSLNLQARRQPSPAQNPWAAAQPIVVTATADRGIWPTTR